MASVLLAGLARASLVGLFLALASLVGWGILPARVRPRRARLALPLALSAGLLGLGWGTWVAGSLLGTWSAPLVLAALALPGVRAVRDWRAATARCARELAVRARRAPAAAALALLPLALAIPSLLAPLADSDGLRYHVALPKLFLLAGRVFLYPWDVTGALPEGMEMLTLLLFPVAGGEVAKLLHFALFAATLALLPLLVPVGRRWRGAGWLAAFLFAASPLALVPAPAAFVDHAGLFHAATALLLALGGAPAAAVGIAIAGALFTKITLLPLAAVALVPALRARRPFRAAFAVALPVLAALAPLAIRNAIATGDPLFPVGYTLLRRPVPGVDPAREAIVFRAERSAPLGVRLLAGAGRPDEALGAHHLLLLAGLLLAARVRPLRPLALLALAFAAAAPLVHPPARFLLPGLLAASLLEGAVLATALGRWAPAAALALAAPALLSAGGQLLRPPVLAYAAGRLDRPAFLAATVPGARAAALVNAQPPGGRVMALDFPAPALFDRPWIAEGILNVPPMKRWMLEKPGAEALLETLRALDVRYLVVTPGYGGGTNASLLPLAFSRESAAALLALRSRLRLVGRVDGVDVWAVPGNAATPVYDPKGVEGESSRSRGGP